MFSRRCFWRRDGDSECSSFKHFIQSFILASGLGKAGLLSPKQKWKKQRKGFTLEIQGNHCTVPVSHGVACVNEQTRFYSLGSLRIKGADPE